MSTTDRDELYWRNQSEAAINAEMERRIERYLERHNIPYERFKPKPAKPAEVVILPKPVIATKSKDAA